MSGVWAQNDPPWQGGDVTITDTSQSSKSDGLPGPQGPRGRSGRDAPGPIIRGHHTGAGHRDIYREIASWGLAATGYVDAKITKAKAEVKQKLQPATGNQPTSPASTSGQERRAHMGPWEIFWMTALGIAIVTGAIIALAIFCRSYVAPAEGGAYMNQLHVPMPDHAPPGTRVHGRVSQTLRGGGTFTAYFDNQPQQAPAAPPATAGGVTINNYCGKGQSSDTPEPSPRAAEAASQPA